MLVLSRERGEQIVIEVGGERVVVTLVENRGNRKARLGFTAAEHVAIHRQEVWEAIERERLVASSPQASPAAPSAVEQPGGYQK